MLGLPKGIVHIYNYDPNCAESFLEEKAKTTVYSLRTKSCMPNFQASQLRLTFCTSLFLIAINGMRLLYSEAN